MAKFHLDRLKQKYGWTGEDYRGLVTDIIDVQTGNVQRKIARQSKASWEKGLRKVGKTEFKRFVVPGIEDALPARAVHLRKAAEQGDLITDTLRDRLTGDLRDTLKQFTPKTGEPTYLKRTGAKAGTINQDLIDQFQDRITRTFKSYAKKDPRWGVPPNVRAIATTEMRGTINGIKREYMEQLVEKNDEIVARKRWIHHRSLSKVFRKGHAEKDRVSLPVNTPFRVKYYKVVKTRYVYQYTTSMQAPHDAAAPGEQVINCNCGIEYFTRVRKSPKKAA